MRKMFFAVFCVCPVLAVCCLQLTAGGSRAAVAAEGTVAAPVNLVVNPSFETDEDGDGLADNWKIWGARNVDCTISPDAVDGKKSQYIKSMSEKYNNGICTSLTVKPETRYSLTFQVKSDVKESSAGVRVSGQKPSYYQLPYKEEMFDVGDKWVKISREFTTTADARTIDLIFQQPVRAEQHGLFIDDVKLVESK